jgi:hypothetical protein
MRCRCTEVVWDRSGPCADGVRARGGIDVTGLGDKYRRFLMPNGKIVVTGEHVSLRMPDTEEVDVTTEV